MKKIILITLVACISLFVACQKTEFMPPPEGEAIPYEDPRYENLEAVLQKSPYQLFYKVWMKSSLSSLLSGKPPHTLLAPEDAAMLAEGYTEAKIAEMTPEEADRFVQFYTIDQRITKENIEENIGNMRVISMLEKPEWKIVYPYAYDQRTVNYRYLHYLGLEDDKFLINGIPVGDRHAAIPASNGYVWPIKIPVVTINKTFKEIMESDPRFTMLVEVKKRSDKAYDDNYRAAMMDNVGWDPGEGSDYNRQYYDKLPLGIDNYGRIMVNTVFLPTDEAFLQAGFSSVDEIIAWNSTRATPMIFDPDYWTVSGGGVPTDTLLTYHYDWGRDNLPYSPIWGKAPDPVPTVFYKNDLTNELLEKVSINNRVGDLQYFMPLSFGRDAEGRVLVQLKGSEAPPATIVETINTAMGPLHVVDRLFVPKGFKMK